MVIIGASCVGSMQLLHENASKPNDGHNEKFKSFNNKITNDPDNKYEIMVNEKIERSDGSGYFQYGGSTVVTVFEKLYNIICNPIIIHLSKLSIEFKVSIMDPLVTTNEA